MTIYGGGPESQATQEQPRYASRAPGPLTRAELIRAPRLWAGGVAAAVVAVLVVVAGFVVVRGLLNLPVLAPQAAAPIGGYPSMFVYASVAAFAALAATGLMYLLLLTTPYPRWFFGWIIGLVTVIVVAVPLALDQPLVSRLATAGINLVTGVAIGLLVNLAGAASIRLPAIAEPL